MITIGVYDVRRRRGVFCRVSGRGGATPDSMRVLVVARTRMRGDRRCIGALSLEKKAQSYRLLMADGSYPSVDSPFQVGEIWEVETTRAGVTLEPPHTEDVRVLSARRVGVEQGFLATTILQRVKPWRGSIEHLFDGLVQFTNNGHGYVSRRTGVPSYSTGFWIPDRQLILDGTHYYYPMFNTNRWKGLAYVGERPPTRRIMAGALVRVSLARWWRPPDSENVEERCYLQLSDWYD